MIKKSLLAISLTTSTLSNAEVFTTASKYNSSEIYYEITYNCVYEQPGFRTNNKRIPDEGDIMIRTLVVGDKIAEALDSQVEEASYRYMLNDKALKDMLRKAKAFEEAGNIQAHEHWIGKLMDEHEKIKLKLKKSIYKEFANSHQQPIPTLHKTSYGSKSYKSFSELTENVNELCN